MKPSRAPKMETRSPRVATDTGKSGLYASYSPLKKTSAKSKEAGGADFAVAHILDVSSTGARLVSRMPFTGKIGDLMEVEFTLDHSDHAIKSQASVVRQPSEYVFAIRFVNNDADQRRALDIALANHVTYRRKSNTGVYAEAFADWMAANKRGATYALVALTIAAAIGGAIFLTSDEHQGRQLKPWGRELPKEWYSDYVNKFTDAWK